MKNCLKKTETVLDLKQKINKTAFFVFKRKKIFPHIKVMALSREEVEQRNRACKQRYYEKNREALLQKAKEARQATQITTS